MQIESLATLRLSFLSCLSLFTSFQRLCGNEGVLVVQPDLPNLTLFCSQICSLSPRSLMLSLSCAVPFPFLPLVTLIRSVCDCVCARGDPCVNVNRGATRPSFQRVSALACQVPLQAIVHLYMVQCLQDNMKWVRSWKTHTDIFQWQLTLGVI